MQLTRYTDYGLRLLIYLALVPPGRRVSIEEISQIYRISPNNLNKIVHQLGKEGIIETKQGKGGGLCLKLAPQEINLAEIVVILENNLQLMDCESPLCRIHSFCKFKNILQQATRSFLNTLGQYTLADLLHQKTELAQALDLAD